MKWVLQEKLDEILAYGPEIDTPSGEIIVVDIDSAALVIKSLIQQVQCPKHSYGDSIIVKDANKFLDCLYDD